MFFYRARASEFEKRAKQAQDLFDEQVDAAWKEGAEKEWREMYDGESVAYEKLRKVSGKLRIDEQASAKLVEKQREQSSAD